MITHFLCDHKMLELEWNHCVTSFMKNEAPKYRLTNRKLEGDELQAQIVRLRTLSQFLQPQSSEIMDWAIQTITFLRSKLNLENKNIISNFIEAVTNVSYTLFQFLYDIFLIFGVGFHSPRYWHTEDFSPKLSKLVYELSELRGVNNDSTQQKREKLRQEIRELRASNRTRRTHLLLSRIEKEGLYSRTFNSLFNQAVGRRGVTDLALKNHFSKVFGEEFRLSAEQKQTVTPLP